MHRLGLLLLWLGAIVGAATALALGAHQLSPLALHGLSWWIALGMVKLTLLGSVGLMGGGAVLLRLARRARERELGVGDERVEQLGEGKSRH